jgi:hypothetical protein
MTLDIGTTYRLSILPGQVFVKEAICSGNLTMPIYYFRGTTSNDCNINNTGSCLQGSLSPGQTGPVQNFDSRETIGVASGSEAISFNTTNSRFIITDTGTYEVSYNISHFQSENGNGTTVHSFFEIFSSSAVITGSESEKTLRNKSDYDTSPGKFTLTVTSVPYEIRLINGYMNTADLSPGPLLPVPKIYVYSRGTVVKFTKLN